MENQRPLILVSNDDGITATIMPRLSLFAQGAYGDPGLNMLEGGFKPYYIAGLRLSWNIGGFYTRKNDKRLLDVSRSDIGFGSPDNAVSLLARDGRRFDFGPAPKRKIAELILKTVMAK